MRRDFTKRQTQLLEILDDGAWHYKEDLIVDPRLGYGGLDMERVEYTKLNTDLRRIRTVAEIEPGVRPSRVRLRRRKEA